MVTNCCCIAFKGLHAQFPGANELGRLGNAVSVHSLPLFFFFVLSYKHVAFCPKCLRSKYKAKQKYCTNSFMTVWFIFV